MRASRLLTILLRLQLEGRVSASALSRSLEVSVRTIYRDVDALSAAGVPVYAEKGRRGGFALHAGYRTRLTGLDRPEAESLFLAGVPFAAAQLGLGAALETTRLKLLASMPESTARDAQRVAARFHLDVVPWFQAPDEQGVLPQLAAAVWEGRVVRLRYESWKGVVDRRAEPLGLVLKSGLWYLVARVDGQPRTYRVGSILALAVEDAAARAPARFDLQRHWQAFAADYESRMQRERARLRVRTPALRALSRLNDATARAVAAAGPGDSGGWHDVTIPVESVDAAVGDLLRLGADVRVVGPRALKHALRDAVVALHAAHVGGDAQPRRARKG